VQVLLKARKSGPGRKAEGILKRQFKALGPLRDAQMQLERIRTLSKRFPQAAAFAKWLMAQEDKHLRYATRIISKLKPAKLEKIVRKAAGKGRVLVAKKGETDNRVHKFLRKGFKQVETRYEALDRQDIETIHDLRIAFKKFRYLAEALVTGENSRGIKAAMKPYQHLLGEIQDWDVVLKSLHKYCNHTGAKSFVEIGALRREIVGRRNAAVERFWSRREQVFKFAPGKIEKQKGKRP
jgi:CHAD domain-containing protein